jgi:hypothetical protein
VARKTRKPRKPLTAGDFTQLRSLLNTWRRERSDLPHLIEPLLVQVPAPRTVGRKEALDKDLAGIELRVRILMLERKMSRAAVLRWFAKVMVAEGRAASINAAVARLARKLKPFSRQRTNRLATHRDWWTLEDVAALRKRPTH